MPNTGTLPSRPRTASTRYGTPSGSPGPLERKTPSGLCSSTPAVVVDAGTTTTSQPAVRSWRRMFSLMPASKATTLKRGAGGVV